MGSVLPPAELKEAPPAIEPHLFHHRTLHALTQILYTHMFKVFYSELHEYQLDSMLERNEGILIFTRLFIMVFPKRL